MKTREDALHLISILFTYPIMGVPDAAKHLQKSYNSTLALIGRFEEIGILQQHTEQLRNRTYILQQYLDVLGEIYP